MSNISFIARRKVPFLHNPVANRVLVSAAVSGIQCLRATKEIGDVCTQTDHLQKVDSQFPLSPSRGTRRKLRINLG